MREPILSRRKHNYPLVAQLEVVKENMVDREVYIPVEEDGYYLVTFSVNGKIVGERVMRAVNKCVKRGRKRYCYKYIRIPLPWSSKIGYGRKKVEINVYKLDRKEGEVEYFDYRREITAQYSYY